jgi:hypothetical protein
MSLLLYSLTAALLLFLAHRCVRPVSRTAALVLYALPFAFVGLALVAGRIYGPVDLPYATEPLNAMRFDYGLTRLHNGVLSDVYCQMIPWRKAVQWSLAHHEWPLWNRFILSGDILAAAAQPAPYSPFTLIACLIPVAHSLTFTAAISHLVAALAAFLFARELGCREGAALVAAAGWTWCTGVAFFILWPLGLAWAFCPFIFLGVKRLVEAPSFASAALLTTGFTLMLLAGHPETVLHVVFLGAAYGVMELAIARRFWRPAIAATIAGVVALALCAIYLLPIFEAGPQTMEQPFRTEVFAKQPRGVPMTDVLARLTTDLFPYLQSRVWKLASVRPLPIDGAAVGSIILALAVFAVWRIRSSQTWFFFGTAVFGLLARAEWTPLARALVKLPLFDLALNERFSFAGSFGLAMLAALGAERLCAMERRDRAATMTLLAVLVFIAAGNAYILRAHFVDDIFLGWGRHTIAAEIAGLALATLAVAFLPRRFVVPSLLALIALQRIATAGGFYRTLEARVAYPPVPIFEPLKHAPRPFRITGHGRAFIPGTAALYELEDARGYEAMTFARYRETYPIWCEHQPVWFNRVDDLTKPFLSFLNVRYAISWDHGTPPDGWREAARQPGSVLLENTRALDRAFVPNRVRLGYDNGEASEQMAQETDFRERAWIEAPLQKQERANGPGAVTRIRDANLGYKFDVNMAEAGWVVISETAWKGWRAYLDGRRVELQVANNAFLGLYVPKGPHRVQLRYWPRSFVIGRWISFLTLLSVACAFGVRRRSRRLSAPAAGQIPELTA